MPYASKEAQRAAVHRHYLLHKEQYAARTKAWRAAHPDARRTKKRMLVPIQQFGEDWFEKAKETILNGGTLTTDKPLADAFWSKLDAIVFSKYPKMFTDEVAKRRQYRQTYLNKKKAAQCHQPSLSQGGLSSSLINADVLTVGSGPLDVIEDDDLLLTGR